jgi:O-antigen/teichoic acid export membrane protein
MLGLGRLGLRLLVLVIGAASAMGMYLLFIPDMGWEGAVIGTVLGEIVLLVAAWAALIWAQRQHDQGLDAGQATVGLDGDSGAEPSATPNAT